MNIETLLFSVETAIIAAGLGTIAYKLLTPRSRAPAIPIKPAVIQAPQTVLTTSEPAQVEAIQPDLPVGALTQQVVSPAPFPLSTMPTTEAPDPFPEEPKPLIEAPAPVMSTTLPTDVSAVANISSPVDNATPVLIIPAPKRRGRSPRKMSSAGVTAPRRKRTPKPKTLPTTTAVEQLGIPVQEQSQEPSAQIQ
jgi:hypothetical protein